MCLVSLAAFCKWFSSLALFFERKDRDRDKIFMLASVAVVFETIRCCPLLA